MLLSAEQTRALAAITKWRTSAHASNEFRLGGYAGTGKTTLVQEMVNGLPDEPLCLAPTGKAASVLQKKLTNARVSTIHSALYKPVPPGTNALDALEAELVNHPNNAELRAEILVEKQRLSEKRLKFSKKADCEISPGQLIVVDEASMVTKQMQRDLAATQAKILYVGDPGQLPPVMDKGFFDAHPPDAMLEEVQRQALDSPIIRVSMKVRRGEYVGPADEPGFVKCPKSAVPGEDWLNFDQVITGSNQARRQINRYFRKRRGFKNWWPQEGDKLICLKNDINGSGYINGILAYSLSDAYHNSDFHEIMGTILYEERVVHGVAFYRYPFQIHYDAAAVEEPWQSRSHLSEFDFAYAITVHKSQGSEWDCVLLADDGMQTGNEGFRRKFLYTAVTRAKKELTWVY